MEYLDKLICGNVLDVLPKIPDESVDLIITSPPYNCGIPYDSWHDDMKWHDYLQWCRQWLAECFRVLKADGRICVDVLIEMGIDDNTLRVSPFVEFVNLYKQVGLHLFGCPIWPDNHLTKFTSWGSWMSAKAPYMYNAYEVIIVGYKHHKMKISDGLSTMSKEDFMTGCHGVWDIHPETDPQTIACFPLELPQLCINMLSYKGDVVLDPFVGSGTTAVAAKLLERHYIGIDISERYISKARVRLARQRTLFDWMAARKQLAKPSGNPLIIDKRKTKVYPK